MVSAIPFFIPYQKRHVMLLRSSSQNSYHKQACVGVFVYLTLVSSCYLILPNTAVTDAPPASLFSSRSFPAVLFTVQPADIHSHSRMGQAVLHIFLVERAGNLLRILLKSGPSSLTEIFKTEAVRETCTRICFLAYRNAFENRFPPPQGSPPGLHGRLISSPAHSEQLSSPPPGYSAPRGCPPGAVPQ